MLRQLQYPFARCAGRHPRCRILLMVESGLIGQKQGCVATSWDLSDTLPTGLQTTVRKS